MINISRMVNWKEILPKLNSEYNWNLIFDVVAGVIMMYQQKQLIKIRFDASHITHYVCFCLEKGSDLAHFFIEDAPNEV